MTALVRSLGKMTSLRLLNPFSTRKSSVVVGMTSNGFTLADPNDRGMMDVVGFDTTVLTVIADFVRE